MYENPFYESYWTSEEELEHFGVKGMKWGVRRYQNKDGTLTEAGLKRLRNYQQQERTTAELNLQSAESTYSKAVHARKAKGKVIPSRREVMADRQIQIYTKEIEEIKRMTYKDMQSDKIAAGVAVLKTAAVAGAMTVPLTMLGASSGVIRGGTAGGVVAGMTAAQNAKTKNRLKRHEKWLNS